MRIRKSKIKFNIVAEIDELIMDLTYVKNGNPVLGEKLKNGVKLIDQIISFTEEPKGDLKVEKLGYSPFHDKQYHYSGEYNIAEHKEDLEKAKDDIEKFINNPENSDKNNIEKIQEMLLAISIPIWNEEISILRSEQYKSIKL